MLITYSFVRVAVGVRRWFEVGPDATMETGARIELALLTPREHRGSESAAQPLVVEDTFWRADIFGRLHAPDDPYAAAHFHPRFDGPEPSERTWSDALTDDPWGWLERQLGDVGQRLADAGRDPGPAAGDAADVRAHAPRIVAAAREFGPEHVLSRDENFRLTRDAALRVRMLVDLVENRDDLDEQYLAPWTAPES